MQQELEDKETVDHQEMMGESQLGVAASRMGL